VEKKVRSFTKSVVWRIIAIVNGFLIACFFLDVSSSLLLSLIANATGFVLYYIHERVWNLINWGKK
jgi:uncharacterized membrane protein